MAPFIVVTSHKGKTDFNFGDIAVGKSLCILATLTPWSTASTLGTRAAPATVCFLTLLLREVLLGAEELLPDSLLHFRASKHKEDHPPEHLQ